MAEPVAGRANLAGTCTVVAMLPFGMPPLLLPTLIVGLGLLPVLQPLGLVATWPGLALGPLVVVLPFVVRLMTTAFAALPPDTAEAAATLGAAPWRAFLRVTLPIALFRYTESRTDPLVAALAVVLVAVSALLVLAVDRLVDFTRTVARP